MSTTATSVVPLEKVKLRFLDDGQVGFLNDVSLDFMKDREWYNAAGHSRFCKALKDMTVKAGPDGRTVKASAVCPGTHSKETLGIYLNSTKIGGSYRWDLMQAAYVEQTQGDPFVKQAYKEAVQRAKPMLKGGTRKGVAKKLDADLYEKLATTKQGKDGYYVWEGCVSGDETLPELKSIARGMGADAKELRQMKKAEVCAWINEASEGQREYYEKRSFGVGYPYGVYSGSRKDVSSKERRKERYTSKKDESKYRGTFETDDVEGF